nr:hypothetical protein [Tanacetum cinerariifolium]
MSFGGAYEVERVVGIIARAVYTKSKEEHELHLKMNLGLLKKEKCVHFGLFQLRLTSPSNSEVVGTIWTKRDGDCLYDASTKDSCEERHDSRYGLRRIDDGWSDLGVVIARLSTIWERANVVVDAWSRKRGVKSRRVRDICRTIQAKVSKKMLVV